MLEASLLLSMDVSLLFEEVASPGDSPGRSFRLTHRTLLLRCLLEVVVTVLSQVLPLMFFGWVCIDSNLSTCGFDEAFTKAVLRRS